MNVAMATHVDPEWNDWQVEAWQHTTGELMLPFTRAVERGEVSDEVDAAALVELLISPMIVRTVIMKETVGPRHARRIADQIIRLARVGGAQTAADRTRRKSSSPSATERIGR